MKRVSSSHFRRTYLAESEPVEVTAYGKVIGRWDPVGSGSTATATEDVKTEGDVGRFTIRPAKHARPELIRESKPIFDPLELRKQEQVRSDEFQARTFGPKRKT